MLPPCSPVCFRRASRSRAGWTSAQLSFVSAVLSASCGAAGSMSAPARVRGLRTFLVSPPLRSCRRPAVRNSRKPRSAVPLDRGVDSPRLGFSRRCLGCVSLRYRLCRLSQLGELGERAAFGRWSPDKKNPPRYPRIAASWPGPFRAGACPILGRSAGPILRTGWGGGVLAIVATPRFRLVRGSSDPRPTWR